LLIAVDVLKLTAFAGFLTQVLDYLPNVVVAVLVFVVAIVISDIVEKIVRVSVERLKVGYGYIAASIVKWAIWVFTFFLILDQLLPTSVLIKTFYSSIVYGIVGALALGIGLAIGLGGKETAGKIISDMHRKMEER
jgi:protein-S-isoprenylcysteine O-methyltransferase Ste14